MVKGNVPVNKTRSWAKLSTIAGQQRKEPMDLSAEFKKDPSRFRQLSVRSDAMVLDYSRQLVNREVAKTLVGLANETGLKQKIDDMFTGKKINVTENRAVLHTALRNLSNTPVVVDGEDVMPQVNGVLERIRKFSNKVVSGKQIGVTGKPIKNIVAIGIGGSYLGPEYLATACSAYAKNGMRLRFVSNVDNTDFVTKTADLDPEETMFVIVSKTFTTAETMKNAETAKSWMMSKIKGHDKTEIGAKHFIAVSTAANEVSKFDIDLKNMFGFWDWVGGRFSATSAVGAVPLSLYIGFDNFHKILEGANWMDRHFRNTTFEKNIPVMAALVDIWNVNFLRLNSRAIIPYSQAYAKYAPHCQQVEMESNGKRVDIHGRPVKYQTGEVLFGEPGTNSQHSFFQLEHLGTQVVPVDFFGFVHPQYEDSFSKGISHHQELMTNIFAQADALAFGKTAEEVAKDEKNEALISPKTFPGNKPSSLFLMNEQDPFTAGAMLALLEHRAAVKGFVWGINSFDQFGVEQGKALGVEMRKRINDYQADPNDPKVFKGLNQSTKAMFRMFLQGGINA